MSLLLFADDTNLFYSYNDRRTLNQVVNQEICKVSNWLTANRLSLNVQKTHFLIFKEKNKRANNTSSIRIKDQNIEQVTNTNFPGLVNIDQDLAWKYHIKEVANKISKVTAIKTP